MSLSKEKTWLFGCLLRWCWSRHHQTTAVSGMCRNQHVKQQACLGASAHISVLFEVSVGVSLVWETNRSTLGEEAEGCVRAQWREAILEEDFQHSVEWLSFLTIPASFPEKWRNEQQKGGTKRRNEQFKFRFEGVWQSLSTHFIWRNVEMRSALTCRSSLVW